MKIVKRRPFEKFEICSYVSVTKLDHCASEALAKVQEKIPIVNQTPSEVCIIK